MRLISSRPLLSLRDRSTISRSGFWLSKRRIASMASAASPQTTRSGSPSINSRRPLRTSGWSSTIRIRARCVSVVVRFMVSGRVRLGGGGLVVDLADDGRPLAVAAANFQRGINDARAVLHDSQPHPAVTRRGARANADAVILDGDADRSVGQLGSDEDLPRLRVLDCVVYRFLHNAKEVCCHHIVVDAGAFVSFDAAIDPAARARFRRQLLEGRHETRGVDLDGNESLHGRADFPEGPLYAVCDGLGDGSLRTFIGRQFLRQPLGEVAQAGQFLAQAVVQVAADALLFVAGDLEHFAFEILL